MIGRIIDVNVVIATTISGNGGGCVGAFGLALLIQVRSRYWDPEVGALTDEDSKNLDAREDDFL